MRKTLPAILVALMLAFTPAFLVAPTADASVAPAAVAVPKPYKNGLIGKQKMPVACTKGKAVCISKKQRLVSYVVNGKVVITLNARLGTTKWPTRTGNFKITRKKKLVISNLYGSRMPYSMFFDSGRAVHYSQDFADRVRQHRPLSSSHGCVNVRDMAGVKYMYSLVAVGTKVIVYN